MHENKQSLFIHSKGISHCPLHFGRESKAGKGMRKLYSKKQKQNKQNPEVFRYNLMEGGCQLKIKWCMHANWKWASCVIG